MTTLADKGNLVQRPPTMKEVAALANVSIKTVSRVINEEPGVSPELSERVLQAIRQLGYHHNTTASNLRRADQRTATIGLLLDDVANPFSSALHRAIEDVANQHDTLVFTGSSDFEADREERMALTLMSRRVDGLIVMPVSQSHIGLQQFKQLDRPIVFVDRPANLYDADSVLADNRVGASVAVRHMAAYGHRRIAFLGDLHTLWTAAERHLGYIEGLALTGLQLDPALVRHDLHSINLAEQATMELFTAPNPPSALFAGQNLITIGVIRALQRLGLQQQVALVGFDDFPLADLLMPRVSVVAQDPALLGKTAAERLFARLDGERSPGERIVIPTQLLIRGSGEITPSAFT